MARPIKEEEYSITIGEVEVCGMEFDFESYLDRKGIRKVLKRPGKLPYLDRQKLFKELSFVANGDVSVEVRPLNEFKISDYADKYYGDSLAKAQDLFEHNMDGK